MRLNLRSAAITSVAAVALSTLALSAPASAYFDDEGGCTGPDVAAAPAHASNTAPVAVPDSAAVLQNGFTVIDVVGNDTDADGDAITLTTIGESRYGYSCIDDGQLVYQAEGDAPRSGTETLKYAITDGDAYRTGTVTLTFEKVAAAAPKVTQKLVLTKKGKVKTAAKVLFSNPDTTYAVHVLVGNFYNDDEPQEVVIQPGKTKTVTTGRGRLDFLTVVSEENASAVVQGGEVRTKTGKVSAYDGSDGYWFANQRSSARSWARSVQR